MQANGETGLQFSTLHTPLTSGVGVKMSNIDIMSLSIFSNSSIMALKGGVLYTVFSFDRWMMINSDLGV